MIIQTTYRLSPSISANFVPLNCHLTGVFFPFIRYQEIIKLQIRNLTSSFPFLMRYDGDSGIVINNTMFISAIAMNTMRMTR